MIELNLFSRYTNRLGRYVSNEAAHKVSLDVLNRLNSDSFTQIGDTIILKDGTEFRVGDIPKLDVRSLPTARAKGNVMDFGSAKYFKYVKSSGESLAIFSMPSGGLHRPPSENMDNACDLETERYLHFWNGLIDGQAMTASPAISPRYGYTFDQVRGYLDEAGISKGFFSVKAGQKGAEFFYSATEQYPLYSKDTYDLRYHTMTSPDFSYQRSVFRDLEPGSEITIAGEKYTLKDDFTLDIPYGVDIYDIHFPEHTPVSKVPVGIDRKV